MNAHQGSKPVVLLLLFAVWGVSGAKVVTIDGAFRFLHNSIVFFAGDEAARTSRDNSLFRMFTRDMYTHKKGFEVSAAVHPEFLEFIIYSNSSGMFQNIRKKVDQEFEYGERRNFLMGGPDAAAKKGETIYVFKGCEMAVRQAWNIWEPRTDVRDAGLPCHIDAAWNEGDDMGVLRGNEIYYWRANGTVDGPTDFNTYFDIPPWEVAPYEGPED